MYRIASNVLNELDFIRLLIAIQSFVRDKTIKQNYQLNKMINSMPLVQNKTVVKHLQINKCIGMLSSHVQVE
jgi:hypothetical protein